MVNHSYNYKVFRWKSAKRVNDLQPNSHNSATCKVKCLQRKIKKVPSVFLLSPVQTFGQQCVLCSHGMFLCVLMCLFAVRVCLSPYSNDEKTFGKLPPSTQNPHRKSPCTHLSWPGGFESPWLCSLFTTHKHQSWPAGALSRRDTQSFISCFLGRFALWCPLYQTWPQHLSNNRCVRYPETPVGGAVTE